MIITKLKGGLGNQMFQYSTGIMLSQKTSTALLLDISWFHKPKNDIERNFDLNQFNITAKEVVYKQGIIESIKKSFNQKILNNHHFDFEPKFLQEIETKIKQNKNVYIEGYFQSEENFKEIRETLLKELSLKDEFKSDEFKKLEQQFKNEESVSVHIRRGDYTKNPSVTKYHGICSVEYYQNAIKEIQNKTSNPIFYFFSDDPKWIEENFPQKENFKIISGKNLSASEELFLMSVCKHNIIANSTFSWWSAWLNQNHDKVVISPTPWVDKSPNPHKNIIPKTWIQIPKNP